MRRKSLYLWVCQRLHRSTSKAQSIKRKFGKFDFSRLRNSSLHKIINRQVIDWKWIFAHYLPNKGFEPNTYKEASKFNNEKVNQYTS